MQRTYYHVAPVAVRDQIASEGITPWTEGRDWNFVQFQPIPVVHLFSDLVAAHEFIDRFADVYPDPPEEQFPEEAAAGRLPVADLWEIKGVDLNVEPDSRMGAAFSDDAVAWITKDSIPAEALRLADTYSIADMSKYRDHDCPDCGTEWDWDRDACPECDPPESRA